MREKHLRDEVSELNSARAEGREEARKLFDKKLQEERRMAAEKLRQRGFTEAQIKDFFAD